MKVLKMLNWLNRSLQGHRWHQLDVELQGNGVYKCERCGMLKNDKASKHTHLRSSCLNNLLLVV